MILVPVKSAIMSSLSLIGLPAPDTSPRIESFIFIPLETIPGLAPLIMCTKALLNLSSKLSVGE